MENSSHTPTAGLRWGMGVVLEEGEGRAELLKTKSGEEWPMT